MPALFTTQTQRFSNVKYGIILAVLTFTVFSRALLCGWVNYDDPDYVYENQHVQTGLTLQNIKWAFTSTHAANWHPLTWLSHMLDVSLYGLHPHGHHLTSVLLHSINAAFLLLILHAMSGNLWRSALVAAVFALHPLRVESVAWISERKDVLSAMFFMLTLAAYIRHTRRPGRWSLAMPLCLFTLGLSAKPMLVTLPLVLLILDIWPMSRAGNATVRPKLILEKTPFLLAAAAAAMVTLFAQHQGEAIRALSEVSLFHRIANAAVSYVAYIRLSLFPSCLALPYPHPGERISLPLATAAIAALLGITAAVFRARKRAPFLLAGWLWYLIMLAPVIGIIQVGGQAMADRYTYLPQIGLLLMVAWSLPEPQYQQTRRALALFCIILLSILATLTRRQTKFWDNSFSLHNRAIACTSHNSVAFHNLAEALDRNGQSLEALAYYEKAAEITPYDPNLQYNWGNALLKLDQPKAALHHYMLALDRHGPRNLDALYSNIGKAFEAQNDFNNAEAAFRKALSLAPDNSTTLFNLGTVLAGLGRLEEAILNLREAVRLDPADPEARMNLAILLSKTGRQDEAAMQKEAALSAARRLGHIDLIEALERASLPQADHCTTNIIIP